MHFVACLIETPPKRYRLPLVTSQPGQSGLHILEQRLPIFILPGDESPDKLGRTLPEEVQMRLRRAVAIVLVVLISCEYCFAAPVHLGTFVITGTLFGQKMSGTLTTSIHLKNSGQCAHAIIVSILSIEKTRIIDFSRSLI